MDVLVEFEPEARWGLLSLAEMERELSEILGRKVDLVDRPSAEREVHPAQAHPGVPLSPSMWRDEAKLQLLVPPEEP